MAVSPLGVWHDYRVPEENVERLRQRINALEKRARRLGMPPIVLEVHGEPEVERKEDANGIIHVRRWQRVRVAGERPILNGWTFVATLQHVHGEENGNGPQAIIRSVPGETVPEQYRHAEQWTCDHCRIRIRRRDTYVVRHVDTGEYRQVGSSCLKDFLGHADPHAIAAYAELLAIADHLLSGGDGPLGDGGFSGDARWIDLAQYLTFVAAVIRTTGWVSRKQARDDPRAYATADAAYDAMFPAPADHHRPRLSPTPEDENVARESLEWAHRLQERPESDLSDYLYNVRVVCASPVLEKRSLGIAASVVHVWMLERQREIERRARRESEANSQFVGEVGDRLEVTATVTYARGFDGNFGPCTLYRFITPDGNILVWFASTGFIDLATGRTYRLRGTVKRHEERDGVRQTLITRAKVVGENEPAPAPRRIRKHRQTGEVVERERA